MGKEIFRTAATLSFRVVSHAVKSNIKF